MKKRNYAKEARYEARPEQVKNRVARNAAAKKMNCPNGQEADHKRPLSKGGTNARSNLRCISRKKNRAGAAKIRESL